LASGTIEVVNGIPFDGPVINDFNAPFNSLGDLSSGKCMAFNTFTQNATDSPKSWADGFLITYRSNSNYGSQVALFNGTLARRQRSAGVWKSWAVDSSGTITPNTGFSIAENRCNQKGDLVEVHFCLIGSFTANTGVSVATISGVALPPTIIRKACVYGVHSYDATNAGYCGLFTNGEINVQITATGTRVVLLDFVYTVDI